MGDYLTDENLPLPEDDELTGWAANAAAKILREQWNVAIADGMPLSEMLSDLDDTVQRLREWRQCAQKIADAQRAGALPASVGPNDEAIIAEERASDAGHKWPDTGVEE